MCAPHVSAERTSQWGGRRHVAEMMMANPHANSSVCRQTTTSLPQTNDEPFGLGLHGRAGEDGCPTSARNPTSLRRKLACSAVRGQTGAPTVKTAQIIFNHT